MLELFRMKARLRLSCWLGYCDKETLAEMLAVVRKHEQADVQVSVGEVKEARRWWVSSSLMILSPVAAALVITPLLGVTFATVAPVMALVAALPLAAVVAKYPTARTIANEKRAGEALLECLRMMLGPRR